MSNDAGFTKGPWGWRNGMLFALHGGMLLVMGVMGRPRPQQLTFSDRNGEKRGGVMYTQKEWDERIGDFAEHPDARLIAAAPDLYEACKHALSCFSPDLGCLHLTTGDANILRAALAKANGTEQKTEAGEEAL